MSVTSSECTDATTHADAIVRPVTSDANHVARRSATAYCKCDSIISGALATDELN